MDFLSSVRLEIGDTDEDRGILPGRRQFTDTELLYAASEEQVTDVSAFTSRDVGRTSAKALEIASTAWASQPEEVVLGPSEEKGKQSVSLARRANNLRAIWGYGSSTGRIGDRQAAPSYAGAGARIFPPGIG